MTDSTQYQKEDAKDDELVDAWSYKTCANCLRENHPYCERPTTCGCAMMGHKHGDVLNV